METDGTFTIFQTLRSQEPGTTVCPEFPIRSAFSTGIAQELVFCVLRRFGCSLIIELELKLCAALSHTPTTMCPNGISEGSCHLA
jgi:hypothetical protein